MHLWGETGKKSLKNVSIDGLEYLSLFSTGIQDPKTNNLTKIWSTTMMFALCVYIYMVVVMIYMNDIHDDDGHHQSQIIH